MKYLLIILCIAFPFVSKGQPRNGPYGGTGGSSGGLTNGGDFVGNFFGDGNGLTNLNGVFATVYVANNGTDTGNLTGSKAAPFLTVSNAVRFLKGQGRILVRGGDYFAQFNTFTGATNILLEAYAGEKPAFWYGQSILPGSFSALTNGIYTATMSASFQASLTYLTNFAFIEDGRDMFLYQTNVPYGTNAPGSQSFPPFLSRASGTNRSEHSLLRRATTIPNMVGSNLLWFVQGNVLYIKPAVSNSIGGIYLPGTNQYESVIYEATAATSVKVKGISTYFGWNGFDYTGVAHTEFDSCYSFGSGQSGFLSLGTGTNISVHLTHCESAGAERGGSEIQGALSPGRVWTQYSEEGCYWHDYLRFATYAGFSVNATYNQSWAVAPLHGDFGFISDGAAINLIGCTTYSNLTAGVQLGCAAIVGIKSFVTATGCRFLKDSSCAQLNDQNDTIEFENCIFDGTGSAAVNVVLPSAHRIRYSGCINNNPGQAGSAFTGGNTAGSTIVMDGWFLGSDSYLAPGGIQVIGSDAIAGYSFYMGAGTFRLTAAGNFDSMGYTNKATAFIRTNTGPFTVTTNTFTTNTVNNITRGQRTTIRVNWDMQPTVTASAVVAIFIDQDNDGQYEETNNVVSAGLGTANTSIMSITDTLSPNARFFFTNWSGSAVANFVFRSAKVTYW